MLNRWIKIKLFSEKLKLFFKKVKFPNVKLVGKYSINDLIKLDVAFIFRNKAFGYEFWL